MLRRLLRWGFHVAAALSLGLCVVAAGMWARSYSYHTNVCLWTGVGWECCLLSQRGRLMLAIAGDDAASLPIPRPTDAGDRYKLTNELRGKPRFPFSIGTFRDQWSNPNGDGPYAMRVRWIMIPHWLLVLVGAVLPARWLAVRVRRNRRRRLGLCLTCGYDLRASKERCPECGTAIAEASAAERR